MCVGHDRARAVQKRLNRSRWGIQFRAIKKPRGCTFALPDKYDGAICAAAVMRPAATVTLATCFNMIPIDSKKANALAALP